MPVTSERGVLAWVPTTATRRVAAASSRWTVGVAYRGLLLIETSSSAAAAFGCAVP